MIEKIANASSVERKAVFLETANIKNMSYAMIEKDFWVCWTLNRLFSNKELSKKLRFKGGTSLSKVFMLLNGFQRTLI